MLLVIDFKILQDGLRQLYLTRKKVEHSTNVNNQWNRKGLRHICPSCEGRGRLCSWDSENETITLEGNSTACWQSWTWRRNCDLRTLLLHSKIHDAAFEVFIILTWRHWEPTFRNFKFAEICIILYNATYSWKLEEGKNSLCNSSKQQCSFSRARGTL